MDITIQLASSKVEELSLLKASDHVDDNGFSLEVGVEMPSVDQQRHFFVALKSEIQLKEGYVLTLTYKSMFVINKDIDEEFRDSHFPRINAPAIAFPYFRAFISTFLLNAGFEPIILPSINFTKLNAHE
ncbi:protein-export chaperone SecB [Acinetobacter pittii]|uniref:protein-export chaperone SecB n=1 Tax=Acinetobacter pittii TaxID=48296 RepID=UPI003260F4F4